jgi:hypothetical protein
MCQGSNLAPSFTGAPDPWPTSVDGSPLAMLNWGVRTGVNQPHQSSAPLASKSLGLRFLIKTDHYSLKFLLDQRLATILQHQWASKLLGFDFQVEFKPGVMNMVADALSC